MTSRGRRGLRLGVLGIALAFVSTLVVVRPAQATTLWRSTSASSLLRQTYSIRFDANGGMGARTMSTTWGRIITMPSATMTNATFDGWYTARVGGTRVGVAGSRYVVISNATLYAHWKASRTVTPVVAAPTTPTSGTTNSGYYTVYYSAPGSLGCPVSTTVRIGGAISLPCVARVGYRFAGWYTAQGRYVGIGGNRYTPTDNSTTLYAYWLR